MLSVIATNQGVVIRDPEKGLLIELEYKEARNVQTAITRLLTFGPIPQGEVAMWTEYGEEGVVIRSEPSQEERPGHPETPSAVPPPPTPEFKEGELVEVAEEPVGAHGTGYIAFVRPPSDEVTYDIIPERPGLGATALNVSGRFIRRVEE